MLIVNTMEKKKSKSKSNRLLVNLKLSLSNLGHIYVFSSPTVFLILPHFTKNKIYNGEN